MPATDYYDVKNKVSAYMSAVYAATDVMTDVISLAAIAKNLEMRLASEPRNLG